MNLEFGKGFQNCLLSKCAICFLSSETTFAGHTTAFPTDRGLSPGKQDLVGGTGHRHGNPNQRGRFQGMICFLDADPATYFLHKLPEVKLPFGPWPGVQWSPHLHTSPAFQTLTYLCSKSFKNMRQQASNS